MKSTIVEIGPQLGHEHRTWEPLVVLLEHFATQRPILFSPVEVQRTVIFRPVLYTFCC
jgi:hypothetical protein